MNTYRITVAYDGTAYRGWQRQENTELTVQGILERRISEIAGKKTVVSGSGRTDSGVHALGQECSLYLEQEIDMDSFKKQLNALLPEDIRVLDISREKRDFHARKSARQIPKGVIHIQAGLRNTIVTVTDVGGQVVSCG